MTKIDITRTELVWPGKYKEDGTLKEVPRVNLPFQVIETVNESRATREAKKDGIQGSLFDIYEGKEGDTFESGWRNKLIWGDNLLVMGSLLEKFAGKIDLIYIDPPFFTGVNQLATVFLGEGNTGFEKETSITEDVAYRNAWRHGAPSFMTWIRDRLNLMRDLLKPSGMIFIRFDQYWSHSVKLIADEVFGPGLVSERDHCETYFQKRHRSGACLNPARYRLIVSILPNRSSAICKHASPEGGNEAGILATHGRLVGR